MVEIRLRISASHFALYKGESDYVLTVRHESEEPTSYTVAADVGDRIFVLAEDATVRAMPPGFVLAVGGTSTELTFDAGMSHATFQWWQAPPTHWGSLAAIASSVERLAFSFEPRYIRRGE